MGLIQILVGAFVASIISLGIAQMMQQARITQRRIGLMSTLAELQKRINYLILDQGAFGISINSADNGAIGAPYTALQAGTAQAGAGGPVKFILHDATGDPANTLDLLGPATMTGNGFTEKGTPCSTFNANAGAGVDDCPISYRIMMSWTCPATVACTDPQLTVAARLVFNPSTQSGRILQRFKQLIQQGAADTTSPTMKFDAVVKRTASSVAREFKMGAFLPAAVGTCGAAGNLPGAGTCSVAGFANHPMFTAPISQNWQKEYDPNNLVTIGAAGNFTFNEIGSYACSVKAYAYNTGTADIALYNVTAGSAVGTATTFAGSTSGSGSTGGAESLLRLDVSVTVPSLPSDTFQIRQQCQSNAVGICSMGFSKNNAATYQALSLICSKLDVSF